MRIAMNNPELYNKSNEDQIKSSVNCLKEYSHKIKWQLTEDTAIDLGCGDGSTSAVVKNSPYCKYKKFVASDINEEMVKFASEHYADNETTFRVMDIEGHVPADLIGAFNHVFSFYALHWIKNQERGFTNIYNLLTDEGDCFITFLASTGIYDVYSALSTHPKWKIWLKDVDIFLSPYHGLENPEKIVDKIMRKCGFKNIDVTCKRSNIVFDSLLGVKNLVQSVEPFNMPNEVFDELFKDFVTVGQDIGILNISCDCNNEVISVNYDYSLIVLYASKN